MHVAPSEMTKPGYYDKTVYCLPPWTKLTRREVDLIPDGRYVVGFKSNHDIHADLPDEYIEVLLDSKIKLRVD